MDQFQGAQPIRLNDLRYFSASGAVAISAGIIYLFGGFERENRKSMMYSLSAAGFIGLLFIAVVFFLPIIFLDSYV
jgi:hypothetical protein